MTTMVTPSVAPDSASRVPGLIDARGLERRFGPTLAVAGVSLQVARGEVVALLGPNGAGKTTTLQMLAGLLPPSAGQATVAGYDVVRESDKVRARVGLMVDEPGFYPEMTVAEYLTFVTRLYRMPARDARTAIDAALDRFMLAAKRHARLSSLSKGMRQKVALVRAIVHCPPVLLLDEPTSALDPLSARAVHDFIRERRAGGDAIVISTHNLPEAETLADRVAVVARGRLRRQGTLAELCRAADGLESFALTLSGPPSGSSAGRLRALHGLVDVTVGEVTAASHVITYRTATPDPTNAAIVASLVEQGSNVITLTPRPHNLEAVYLHVIEEADRCA